MAKDNCKLPPSPKGDICPGEITKIVFAKICECSTYPLVGIPSCPLCKGKGYIGDLIKVPVNKRGSSSGQRDITMKISLKKP